MNQILLWVAFDVFVLAMLALDLGVFHRRAQISDLTDVACRKITA